jgi:hypothetical protein
MGLLDVTPQSTPLTSVEQLSSIGFKMYHQYEVVTDCLKVEKHTIMNFDKTFYYEDPHFTFFEKTRFWVNFLAHDVNGNIVIDVDILNFDRQLYQKNWTNEYLQVRNEPLRYSVSEIETVQMMLTKDWFTSLLKELIENNRIVFPNSNLFF